ncbi:rab-like protein 6 [Protopterus annectens]|uniref:rab-like protein 6 n=1 Tax=Protopterus annectens TaxID=7888 RepID=UPI001CF938D0|nr:rab-like protein 6 [Protopterus annectens]
MLSALKKLVGSEQGPMRDSKIIPAGLQSMNQSLQRRFAKGVQYNMKIVIRGDRNTGKTTLWHRLQGKKFVEDYIPTQAIQVTSIHWNYKTTDDVVKVEVWDIVDKGKTKKRGDTLKLENDPQEADTQMALDAEFLDVYKNCNGVVMMFDITKQWTFNYIEKELPNVPRDIPVCVLGNYRDMGEHRVILPDDVRTFIDRLNRPPGSSYILYAESSMKNSFGLKYLHKFFNIPFLQLQRETLLRQLETNQLDIDATLEELCVQQETEDQNYEIFLDMMEARSRGCPTPLSSNGQSPSSGSQSPVVPPNSASTGSSSPGVPLQPAQSCPPNSTPSPSPSTSPAPVREPQDTSTPSPSSVTPAPPVANAAAPTTQRRSIISRLFGSSAATENSISQPDAVAPSPVKTPNNIQSLDDFVPEESLDRSFLEDSGAQKEREKAEPHDSESDAETGGGNPMVAGFQDDLDPDDQVLLKSSVKDRVISADITLSSDEEEAKRHKVLEDEDIHVEKAAKWSSTNSVTPNKSSSTKTAELKGTVNVPPILPEKVENKKPALGSYITSASASAPSSTPAVGSVSNSKSVSQSKVPASILQQDSSSDDDLEGPIATQMLSFVMDDPDFESEDSDSRKKTLEISPVRAVISDISDEDISPPKVLEPVKSSTRSFKPKNDSDLFGLGFVEKTAKESSEEDKESKSSSSREKKKKKKKKKEEEEKGSKKKSKPKKSKEKEKEGGDEEEKKRKKHHKSKEKEDDVDELEAFLSGRDPPKKKSGAAVGEDYEEL